jgi:hypothetical protein
MKKKQVVIVLVVIVGILALGIGYAAIATQGFRINGNLSSNVDSSQFNVRFTGTPSTNVGSTGATASATLDGTDTNGRTANLSVSGLTAKDQTVTATYNIINNSASLKANLGTPSITVPNDDYFAVTTEYANAELAANGGTTTLTVTVRMKKTPIDPDDTKLSSAVTITFDATPDNA